MTITTIKRTLGMSTHEHTGSGYRYKFTAYFDPITMKDGTVRSYVELVHEFSWEVMRLRRKFAEGHDEREACRVLADLNGLAWPDESPTQPKRRGRTAPAIK